MKQVIVLALGVAALYACQSPKQNAEETKTDTVALAPPPPPVTLTKKWETDTVLTTCESVIYDKDNDVLYVANINGAPDGKDGNGFIAKVGLDGKVIEPKFVKGIDAPKGMGIANGKLYVTDIDRVHEIDLKTGKVVKTYKAPGAKFLNDIATDSTGKVFVSDMMGNNILVLEKGKLTKWMDVDGPNGLFSDGQSLLEASWNSKALNSIDVTSKQVTMKADSIENPDGVEAVGDGAYLVSSWNGMISYVDKDNKVVTLLDTRADSVSSADIEYIQDKNLLLVPTFFKNKVVAYELKKP